jgi:hypothetical protein
MLSSIKSLPTRTLLAHGEHFSGMATYCKIWGVWSCVQADTCIHFLLNKSPQDAKFSLLKRNINFNWVSPHDKGPGDRRPFRTASSNQSAGTNPSHQGLTNPSSSPRYRSENDTATLAGSPIVTDGCPTHSAEGGSLCHPASHSLDSVCDAVVPTAGGVPHTAPVHS